MCRPPSAARAGGVDHSAIHPAIEGPSRSPAAQHHVDRASHAACTARPRPLESAPRPAYSLPDGGGGDVDDVRTFGVLSPFVGGDYYGAIIAGVNRAAAIERNRIIAFQTLAPGSHSADQDRKSTRL